MNSYPVEEDRGSAPIDLDELVRHAYETLPRDVFTHIIGGSGDERTIAANRAGFGVYRLLRHALTDVSNVDLGGPVLDGRFSAPIFVSPVGGIGSVHRDGEAGLMRAAANVGVGYVLSGAADITIEEAASIADVNRWYQLYWHYDRAVVLDLMARAESSGYKALVLTVDRAVRPRRTRMLKGGYYLPPSADTINLRRYRSEEWKDGSDSANFTLTWENVKWLIGRSNIKVILKGIMTVDDARHALDIGADGIIVSNHGGRNLDSEPGTIEVLEDISNAVGSEIVIMMDGGIRRSTDILIALGLGAKAVGVGSPLVWALACGGEDLVTQYLRSMVDDLATTMGLLGVPSVNQITRDCVSGKGDFVPDWALEPFLPPR